MRAKLSGGAGRGRGLTYGASLSITAQRSPEKHLRGFGKRSSVLDLRVGPGLVAA